MIHRLTRKKKNQFHKGMLIIVGGAEEKTGDRKILKRIAERTGSGILVIVTAASQLAKENWKSYQTIFKELGVKRIKHLEIENPLEARSSDKMKILKGASTIFFTGGDQLKITTKIGGTFVAEEISKIYQLGGTVAGTSAGAAVMGETMLVGKDNSNSHKVGNWMMAPGLGLVKDIIIDQHFAQRGRLGRLIGAFALNPGVLGLGIDENTAVMISDGFLEVLGQNAVYIIDGRKVTYTNISQADAERTMSMHDVTLHILCEGENFDLRRRQALSFYRGRHNDKSKKSSRMS